MITTILWDVDGTLLNFIAAEKAAMKALFKEYGLGECSRSEEHTSELQSPY